VECNGEVKVVRWVRLRRSGKQHRQVVSEMAVEPGELEQCNGQSLGFAEMDAVEGNTTLLNEA